MSKFKPPEELLEDDIQDEQPPPTVSYREELAYLFNDVYKNFIIEHVKFDEIVTKVDCMRSHAHDIHVIRNERGVKVAAEKFMELLKKLPDEGNNYQELLQALKDCEYHIVVKAIEEGQIKYQHEEHKKLMSLFSERLEQQLDPVELASQLLERKVITFAQELIIRTKAEGNKISAIFQLLDDIPRKNSEWFFHFWEALYSLDKKELCQLLAPEWYEERMTEEASDHGGKSFEHDRSQHGGMTSSRASTTKNIPEAQPSRASTKAENVQEGASTKTENIPAVSQWTTSLQAGPKFECVHDMKNLQEQVKILSVEVKANSQKLDEILSILKHVKL